WRCCDDSRVSDVSDAENVVSAAAYVLFYRRRLHPPPEPLPPVVQSPTTPLITSLEPPKKISSVEPMQVDAVQEDNENRDIPDNFNVDGAPLDLETYVHSYVGLGRLNRLIFIADHCTELRLEALKLALQYVLKTHNIAMYQLIHRKILEAFGSLSIGSDA
ncbi:unnamed protein product, partial [Cyprideis torosa]